MDEVALILNGLAALCVQCRKPVRKKYLKLSKCPDCRPDDPKPSLPSPYGGFGTPPGHSYDQSDAD